MSNEQRAARWIASRLGPHLPRPQNVMNSLERWLHRSIQILFEPRPNNAEQITKSDFSHHLLGSAYDGLIKIRDSVLGSSLDHTGR